MKQLVVSSIKEVIDKIESVTDAVKQWWLPRASLNEELIETFVELPLQWWIAWRFDLHFAVFVMEIANETILFTGRYIGPTVDSLVSNQYLQVMISESTPPGKLSAARSYSSTRLYSASCASFAPTNFMITKMFNRFSQHE